MGYNNLKNTFFLYDVDGKIAELVPDGGMLQIREPEMQDVKIYLKRDEDNHGVVYEFSDEETPFGFNRTGGFDKTKISPYDMLKILYALDGYDAKCQIIIKTQDIYSQETVKTLYTGNLDFETYKEIDVRINLSSRRIDFDDLFRTRYDTPVNYAATESIDGESITGLTPETMNMHGQKIFSQTVIQANGAANLNQDLNAQTCQSWVKEYDFQFKSLIDDIQYTNGDQAFIQVRSGEFVTPQGFYGAPDYELKNPNEIILNKEAEFSYVAEFTFTGNITILPINSSDPASTTRAKILLRTENGSNVVDYDLFPNVIDIPDGVNLVFPVNTSFEIIKDKDDENPTVCYVVLILTPTSGCVPFFRVDTVWNEFTWDYTFNSSFPASECDVYRAFDTVNHISEVISNVQNPLESSFLENEATLIYNTNGYKLREINDIDKSPIFSFKDVLDNWLAPMFGVGWMTYFNSSEDKFKLLVEKYEYFYQDKEIYEIQESQLVDGTFEISLDSKIVSNKVKIGYKDFPKSTDENKVENLSEFNTQHIYNNPVKTIENESKYICNHISSGFKVENQRKEQFKFKPRDTVSDDDKPFSFTCIKNDGEGNGFGVYTDTLFSSTENKILFTYIKYPVKSGDTMTISGTGSNDGVYSVISVELGALQLFANSDPYFGLVVEVAEQITQSVQLNSFAFGLQEARLYALTDEGFSNIQGVPDRFTTYNIALNPRYMLFNQAPIINSGLAKKSSTSEIKPQEVKLNGQLDCTLDGSIPIHDYIRGAYDVNVKMDQSFPLSEYNNNEKLFSGSILKFQANLPYDDVLLIRDRSTNQGDENNLGYISVNYRGNLYKGFLIMMGYTLGNGATEFELREKYTPTGGAFDYVLDAAMS